MTNSSGSHCFLSTTKSAVILFILANSLVRCGTQDDQPITRVQIDWDALPEQFNNDKLPSNVEPTNRQICHNLIGCYEQIPIDSHYLHQDPTKFRTEFLIHSRNNNGVRVTYERVENCLPENQCDIYPFNLDLIKSAPFKINRRTVIIIGGYHSKAPSRWQTKIKDLWLAIEDVNIIIAAWPRANSGLYRDAAANSRPVGRQLVVLLYYLAKLNKLELNDESFAKKIYIIGHSLGAHIAGFVGQDMNSKIGRITGLEAAGPDFDKLSDLFRLDKTDAQLVDALHTNCGAETLFSSYYGTSLTNGHIDLYANDGRHQPGCGTDRLGCSHQRATEYYIEFLVNQLKIREQMRLKPTGCELNYRLAAYSSPSYEEFHNGSALAKVCPITTLDNNDLSSSDLNHCSIPIDYVSWFNDYRDELEHIHSISFNNSDRNYGRSSGKYYFYTSESDEHRDHYLIRIQASKSETMSYTEDCNCIVFDISMHNGLNTRLTVKNYKLLPEQGEYEMVVPFLSADAETKLELAKLDLLNYHLIDDQPDQPKLVQSLMQIFPSSIAVSRSNLVGKQNGIKRGVVGFFKDLFNMKTKGDAATTTTTSCQLDFITLTVQPLRRMNRHLVATYSDRHKTKPEVIVLEDGDGSPIESVLKDTSRSLEDKEPEFFMNKVIIGPYGGPPSVENDPPATPSFAVVVNQGTTLSPTTNICFLSTTTLFIISMIMYFQTI